ncbi:unnamed protein product [Cylicocyclus nassatus]|uniref:Secreted protein n=1 Tax=Cylicocyclus nassatus TaxID=53992 RepID=A0AA36H9C2_CYLNA|nr:unnamed protein product [Cylicocyclus nassatus]
MNEVVCKFLVVFLRWVSVECVSHRRLCKREDIQKPKNYKCETIPCIDQEHVHFVRKLASVHPDFHAPQITIQRMRRP